MVESETPFLDFYKECMKNGIMHRAVGAKTDGGLCSTVVGPTELFRLMVPTNINGEPDYDEIGYWGAGDDYEDWTDIYKRQWLFTPLRQTIVLFCAAMNNEL